MPYIITNGTYYVSIDANNKPFKTTSESSAKKFKESTKAENFIFSNLSKWDDKHSYKVEFASPVSVAKTVGSIDTVYRKACPNNEDIINIVEQVSQCAERVTEQHNFYEQQLKEADAEILDILHAAEFYNLNAAQGYKLYRMLQNARKKRRTAKDGVEITTAILSQNVGQDMVNHLTERLANHVERSYRPRVFNELFGSTT